MQVRRDKTMMVCTRGGKSQWVFVVTHSDKLRKQLEKSGQQYEDISAEYSQVLVESDKEYRGHTPDGIISYPHREVLEVKVILTKKTIESMLTRHLHQLQLRLLIHKSRKGRLLFYVAPSQMTEFEPSTHIVDPAHVEVGTFLKDDKWVQLQLLSSFRKCPHLVEPNQIKCFYKVNFDADEA
jgi:hypothetical protein